MGWQTDWLYQLIFDELAALWSKANKEGKGEFGPAPEYFLIQQCATADWNEFVGCLDPVLKQWYFDDKGLQPLTGEAVKLTLSKQGMFFEVGNIRFCIAPDRKHVTMTYVLGPRYSAGKIFVVSGQGKTGKLRAFGPGWIS